MNNAYLKVSYYTLKYKADILFREPIGQPALRNIIPKSADGKIELRQDYIKYQSKYQIEYHSLQPGAYAE